MILFNRTSYICCQFRCGRKKVKATGDRGREVLGHGQRVASTRCPAGQLGSDVRPNLQLAAPQTKLSLAGEVASSAEKGRRKRKKRGEKEERE
jgi:hypothetical protein